ncbi:ABC transporter permease subunit, partial [Rhizobium leguminosarum]|uniref:ABC transporter permease subunit n=1 Tax=Rhizobium leguminosarum TaxID=384 RepID=UPI003F963033
EINAVEIKFLGLDDAVFRRQAHYCSTGLRLAGTGFADDAELYQEYIVAARAKGISETRVIWGHALRNAAVPLVTVI